MTDIFSPELVSAARVDRELAVFSTRPEILRSMVYVAFGRPCQQLVNSAPGIICPVLFLHGREDALVLPANARAIHDRIVRAGGRSEFCLIANAGHMLLEFQADEIASAVGRFLTSVRHQSGKQ